MSDFESWLNGTTKTKSKKSGMSESDFSSWLNGTKAAPSVQTAPVQQVETPEIATVQSTIPVQTPIQQPTQPVQQNTAAQRRTAPANTKKYVSDEELKRINEQILKERNSITSQDNLARMKSNENKNLDVNTTYKDLISNAANNNIALGLMGTTPASGSVLAAGLKQKAISAMPENIIENALWGLNEGTGGTYAYKLAKGVQGAGETYLNALKGDKKAQEEVRNANTNWALGPVAGNSIVQEKGQEAVTDWTNRLSNERGGNIARGVGNVLGSAMAMGVSAGLAPALGVSTKVAPVVTSGLTSGARTATYTDNPTDIAANAGIGAATTAAFMGTSGGLSSKLPIFTGAKEITKNFVKNAGIGALASWASTTTNEGLNNIYKVAKGEDVSTEDWKNTFFSPKHLVSAGLSAIGYGFQGTIKDAQTAKAEAGRAAVDYLKAENAAHNAKYQIEQYMKEGNTQEAMNTFAKVKVAINLASSETYRGVNLEPTAYNNLMNEWNQYGEQLFNRITPQPSYLGLSAPDMSVPNAPAVVPNVPTTPPPTTNVASAIPNAVANATTTTPTKVTTDTALDDIRNFKEVGNRKINAYQYDNPEVKPFFQHEAQNMLRDLNNVIKGERTATWDDYGELRYSGVTRETTKDIADLLDGKNGVKLSYDDIRKGLEAIIKDQGSENIAAAKRIEMVLDNRLRKGYTDSYGAAYEPNENYKNFLQGKKYIEPAEYEQQRAEEMIARENGLTEKQTNEINDYIKEISNDTTLDDTFKEQTLNKFDDLTNYEQFNDIKQDVAEYKNSKLPRTDNLGKQLSKQQQEYFKNSKVKDKSGNLLEVYHGTTADFDEFRQTDGALGRGIYFTEDKKFAEGRTPGAHAVSVYLNIVNPYITDYPGNYNQEDLIKQGFDGIYHEGNKFWVAFKPNQIKSTENLTPNSDNNYRQNLQNNDMLPTNEELEKVETPQDTAIKNDTAALNLEKPKVTIKTTPRQTNKIGDFGEKIGGARKDISIPTERRTKQVIPNYTVEPEKIVGDDGQEVESYSVKFKGKKLSDGFKTQQEAVDFINNFKNHVKQNAAVVEERTALVRKTGEKKTMYEVSVVDPKTLKKRSTGKYFDKKEDAEEFALALSMYVSEHGKNLFRPTLQRVERYNPAVNNSTKATGQEILDRYKFRAGEFGNWVNNKERQKFLNYGYDALNDLATAMEIAPEDISFGGKMAIAFGARGHGLSGASAHFEPIKKVFNMTKLKGAGSAAHEMGHGFDNYLSQLSGYDPDGMLSSSRRYKNLPKPIQDSFEHLLDVIQNSISTDEEEISKKNSLFEKARKEHLDYHLSYYDKVFRGEATKYKKVKGEYKNVPIEVTEEQKKEYQRIRKILEEGKLDSKREYDLKNTGRDLKSVVTYGDDIEKLKSMIKEVTGRKIEDDDIYWIYRYGQPAEQVKEVRSKSAFSKSAEELDKFFGRADRYHSKIEEMLARSFEAFIFDELKKKGISSQYLVHSVYNDNYALFNPYPAGEERVAIDKAWRDLINTMKQEGFFHEGEKEITPLADHDTNRGYADEETPAKPRNVRKTTTAVNKPKTDLQAERKEIKSKESPKEYNPEMLPSNEEIQKVDKKELLPTTDELKQFEQDKKQAEIETVRKGAKALGLEKEPTPPIEPPKPPTEPEEMPDYPGNKKERKHVETIANAPGTPKEVAKDIRNDERKYYTPQSNEETLSTAKDIIDGDYDRAERKFIEKELNTAEDVAVADLLIQKAVADGDYAKADELAISLSEKLTKAGQVVQAASIIKRLSPEGMLIYAEKELSNAVDKIKKENPRWFNKLIDQGVISQGRGKGQAKIELTDEEKKTIVENMSKAQTMEDGREKDILVAKTLAMIANKIPASTLEKVASLRRNGLLMNFKTLNRNIGSNTAFGLLEAIKDVPATAIDKAVSLITGQRTTSLPNLKAYYKGGKEGGKYALQDLYYGIDTTFDDTGGKLEIPTKAFKRENSYAQIVDAFKKASFKDGAKMAFKRLLSDYEDAAMFAVNGTDRPFWQARFENELANQMKLNGLKYGEEAPTKEMMEVAKESADYATFKNKNKLSSTLSMGKMVLNNGKPIGLADALGLTFTNVPGSVGSKIYDYTAGGFIKSAKELYHAAMKDGQFNQRHFVDYLARSITGITGVALLGGLIAKGILTGSYDDDKDKADLEREMGIQKNAINLSALGRLVKGEDTKLKKGDKFYNFDWVQPVSGLAILGANLYKKATGNSQADTSGIVSNLDDENEYYVKTKTEPNYGDLAMEFFTTTANQVADMSSLGNFSDLFKGYEGLGGNLADIPGNFASSFIPTLSNNIAQYTDETARNTKDNTSKFKTSINKIINKIPKLRETLEPKVNTLGKEKQQYVNGNDFVSTFLNPGYYTTYDPSDVQQELMDVYEETGDKTIFPSTSPGSITFKKETVKLKPEGVTEFQKASGQYASSVYDALLDSDFYKTLEPSDKAKILTQVATDSTDVGKAAVGIETDNYFKLDTKREQLDKTDMSLADYYIYASQLKGINGKQAKINYIANITKAINEQEGENYIDKDDKAVLYDIFGVN